MNNKSFAFSKEIDDSVNCEAQAIQAIIEEHELKPYNLFFVLDGDNETYKAEYLTSLADFHTRKHLL